MTPLSQILKLVEDYKSLEQERSSLLERLVGGDQLVEIDVLFTEGPYRTKISLAAIAAEVENGRNQIANALTAIGIDINA